MENSNKYACKFYLSNDTGETHTIFVWSNNEEIRLDNETDDISKRIINSFLTNYQNEEAILRIEVILYMKVLIYCLITFIK